MSAPNMQDYASRQRHPRQHGLGIALVLVLHLLFYWAIESGLVRTVTQKAQVVVDAVLLSEDKPSPAQPAPRNLPPPTKSAPPVAVPPVDVPVRPPALTSAVTAVSTPPATAAPVTAAVPAGPRTDAVRMSAVVNAAQCEKPEYPSASRRLEEEGTVQLRFLVGVDGKVIQAEVEKSSGYKRLDEAARAGLSRCQFRPATVDGKPEQAWASMRYTWRLE
ncbi:MAG: energy transducer TonB [Limnohabitans sp.]